MDAVALRRLLGELLSRTSPEAQDALPQAWRDLESFCRYVSFTEQQGRGVSANFAS